MGSRSVETMPYLSDCLARSLVEASVACSRHQRWAVRSRQRLCSCAAGLPCSNHSPSASRRYSRCPVWRFQCLCPRRLRRGQQRPGGLIQTRRLRGMDPEDLGFWLGRHSAKVNLLFFLFFLPYGNCHFVERV